MGTKNAYKNSYKKNVQKKRTKTRTKTRTKMRTETMDGPVLLHARACLIPRKKKLHEKGTYI